MNGVEDMILGDEKVKIFYSLCRFKIANVFSN